MPTYRLKPEIVTAYRYNHPYVPEEIAEYLRPCCGTHAHLNTNYFGEIYVKNGQWIILGSDKEFFVLDNESFIKRYEPC